MTKHRISVFGLFAIAMLASGASALATPALLAQDDRTVGILAFIIGILHGDNIILMLKALAPEAKVILVGLGAICVSIGAFIRSLFRQ